jgi:hypothetical protein
MANVKNVLGLCVGVALCAASAHAQTPAPSTEKFFLNVNTGGQLATRTITVVASKSVYDETASVSSTQTINRGVTFDFDGGYRVRSDFFVGLLVSSFHTTSDATTSASIPDPIFFNRPKTVTGSTTGLKRGEVAIAPHVTWARTLTDKFDINFSGGIAFIHVSQDLAGNFDVPKGTQSVAILQTTETKNGTGPYAQIDLVYGLKPNLGIGGFVRYAGAKVDFASVPDANIGGMQAGGGVRLRF